MLVVVSVGLAFTEPPRVEATRHILLDVDPDSPLVDAELEGVWIAMQEPGCIMPVKSTIQVLGEI